MTVDVIDHKKTELVRDTNRPDMKFWLNHAIEPLIGSDGNLYSWKVVFDGVKHTIVIGRPYKKSASGQLNFNLRLPNGDRKKWSGNFNGLFARAVLGVSLRGKTLIKLIQKDDYTPENVQVVGIKELIKIRQAKVAPRELTPAKIGVADNEHRQDYHKESSRVLSQPIPTESEIVEEFTKEFVQDLRKGSVTIDTLIELGFVKKNTKPERFVTEDGAEFPTKYLADWHQEKVDKGKTNAEIVLSYKGGWSLAEKIYLQEVNYGDNPKPYENFRDIFDQDLGVVSVQGAVTYTIVNYTRKDELNLDIPEELSHDDALYIVPKLLELCYLKEGLEKKLKGLINGKTPTLAG